MMGIMLVGEPGSGKSTIAAALCEQLGWRKLSFAAALKDEVSLAIAFLDGMNRDELVDLRRKMDDPETKDFYRPILQTWGTEFRRSQDPDYWVKRLDVDGFAVIDDVRFNNEYIFLKRKGFQLVRLESGETTRPVQAHGSEVDWKTWPTDLFLSYEKGPEHQANRIIKWMEDK